MTVASALVGRWRAFSVCSISQRSAHGGPGDGDPAVAGRFTDRLKRRLVVMQKELGDDEQLEVVAFLPSGTAVTVDTVGYERPALLTLSGHHQSTWISCALLVHQSSLQILVSVEKVPVGQARTVTAFSIR